MTKPLFTEILHACVVVRDLDAAVRTYYDEYGIGPWFIYEFNPETVDDLRFEDRPAEFSWRLALARVGESMIELIQPLDDKSSYAEFLRSHGEGVHHLAFRPSGHDEVSAELRRKGKRHVQGGVYEGVRFDYFGTENDLGFILEVVDLPAEAQPPDAVYPPQG